MSPLAYLHEHGLNAETIQTDQIAVWPETSITPEIESWIIQHKQELISELRHDWTPPPPDQRKTAATGRAEAWKPAHESMINHLMACNACHAPTSRYCEQGLDLRRIYEDTHEQQTAELHSRVENERG